MKMAKDLRLKLTDNPLKANYVVVGEIKRTARFMSVLCVTPYILKKTWLIKSYEQRKVLPPTATISPSSRICYNSATSINSLNNIRQKKEPYLLIDDVEAERKFQFSMKETLEEGKKRRKLGGLLAGFNIFVCEGIVMKEAEMRKMVQAAGGKWLAKKVQVGGKGREKERKEEIKDGNDSKEKDRVVLFVEDPSQIIVITSDPPLPEQLGDDIVSNVIESGASCFTTTWLFNSMMHQKVRTLLLCLYPVLYI